jgi:para-aminobenzoate synthetase component 1
MTRDRTSPVSAAVEVFDVPVAVEAAAACYVRRAGAGVLESSQSNRNLGRFSILACDPINEFVMEQPGGPCPFEELAKVSAQYPVVRSNPTGLPFVGGWIGYFGYESGLATECLTPTIRRDIPLPAVRFRLYDTAAIYDHCEQRWFGVAVDWPANRWNRTSTAERLHRIRELLNSAKDPTVAVSRSLQPATIGRQVPQVTPSPWEYAERVARAKAYIEAGDIYQVNLSQRFETRATEAPWRLYERLRRVNPAPFSAFLADRHGAVLSASPELFLQLREGRVRTRPIKGTRPRTGHEVEDARRRQELNRSEKDRAELDMIIDLLRNDLGRVCGVGTVRVTDRGTLEEHPTVYHRVATIEGELAPDRDWVDLLRAAFPGGSVTGAPKIRAMQIIDELEPTARGVYCGCLGWIGLDGSMTLNLAIRTMVQTGNRVYVHAGGAIVADSDAASEAEEIQAKAAGLLATLGGPESVEVETFQETGVA